MRWLGAWQGGSPPVCQLHREAMQWARGWHPSAGRAQRFEVRLAVVVRGVRAGRLVASAALGVPGHLITGQGGFPLPQLSELLLYSAHGLHLNLCLTRSQIIVGVQEFSIFAKGMKEDGKDSQRQEHLAAHFGEAPSLAHRAMADVETLQKLLPHLIQAAGITLTQLLESGKNSVGMVPNRKGMSTVNVCACLIVHKYNA